MLLNKNFVVLAAACAFSNQANEVNAAFLKNASKTVRGLFKTKRQLEEERVTELREKWILQFPTEAGEEIGKARTLEGRVAEALKLRKQFVTSFMQGRDSSFLTEPLDMMFMFLPLTEAEFQTASEAFDEEMLWRSLESFGYTHRDIRGQLGIFRKVDPAGIKELFLSELRKLRFEGVPSSPEDRRNFLQQRQNERRKLKQALQKENGYVNDGYVSEDREGSDERTDSETTMGPTPENSDEGSDPRDSETDSNEDPNEAEKDPNEAAAAAPEPSEKAQTILDVLENYTNTKGAHRAHTMRNLRIELKALYAVYVKEGRVDSLSRDLETRFPVSSESSEKARQMFREAVSDRDFRGPVKALIEAL